MNEDQQNIPKKYNYSLREFAKEHSYHHRKEGDPLFTYACLIEKSADGKMNIIDKLKKAFD